MRNWKTSIAIVPLLATSFLLYRRVITVKDAVELTPVFVAYLSFVSADATKKQEPPK